MQRESRKKYIVLIYFFFTYISPALYSHTPHPFRKEAVSKRRRTTQRNEASLPLWSSETKWVLTFPFGAAERERARHQRAKGRSCLLPPRSQIVISIFLCLAGSSVKRKSGRKLEARRSEGWGVPFHRAVSYFIRLFMGIWAVVLLVIINVVLMIVFSLLL